MQLATLNAWGMRGDWPDRLAIFQGGFRQLDADIVVLQETILTGEVDQAAVMLGDGYYLAQQSAREMDGQGITTASRWPIGQVIQVDLKVTERTGDFACGALITEILAPDPWGRVWVANHFPDYQVDHERERRLQAALVARTLEDLVRIWPGHVVVAGDMDADGDSDSLRFWTGRHVIDDLSVCYRSAWESARPLEPLVTFSAQNPHAADWDWPFKGIDHILIRCGDHGGPTLPIRECRRIFDAGTTSASDHYGLSVELSAGPPN